MSRMNGEPLKTVDVLAAMSDVNVAVLLSLLEVHPAVTTRCRISIERAKFAPSDSLKTLRGRLMHGLCQMCPWMVFGTSESNI